MIKFPYSFIIISKYWFVLAKMPSFSNKGLVQFDALQYNLSYIFIYDEKWIGEHTIESSLSIKSNDPSLLRIN